MAGSLNRVQLLGHLGRDPEVRSFANGGKVCSLRVATSDTWKDRETGEKKERTQWHSVSIFAEGLVRIAEQYLQKGSKVMLEGQLETRKWQDQNGTDRYSTEVVLRPFNGTLILLSSNTGQSNGSSQGNYGAGSDQHQPDGRDSHAGYDGGSQGSTGPSRDIDDEIPF